MGYFLIYIIKSTFCLTLFYLSFKALLSRETFLRFNRFVLLTGMIVCAILPLMELKVSQTTAIQEPVAKIEDFFMAANPASVEIIPEDYDVLIEPEIVSSEHVKLADEIPVTTSITSFSIIQAVNIIYQTGFFITLALLFVSIFKAIQIIRKGTKIRLRKYTVVCVSGQICPFSWGRYIVLSENDYQQNPDEILTHEEIHICKRHSLDLLFAELFILFHWFNPVAWFLKKELQDIHEYEADRGVINQGIDAIKYQLLLVKKAVGASSYAITNSFNHSKIKKRITMMLKRKSTHWARLKLLPFVPLAVVLLQAFARPEITGIEETFTTGEVTTISKESKQPEGKPDVRQEKEPIEPQKTEQQKAEPVLSNELPEVDTDISELTIIEDTDSIKRFIVNGSAVIVNGDDKITVDGDNVKISLEPTQIKAFREKAQTDRIDSLLKDEIRTRLEVYRHNAIKQINSTTKHKLDSLTKKMRTLVDPDEIEEIQIQIRVIQKLSHHKVQLSLDSLQLKLWEERGISQEQLEKMRKRMEEHRVQREESRKRDEEKRIRQEEEVRRRVEEIIRNTHL